MDDTILDARWVIDSESSIEYLIDLNTGKVIMVRGKEDGK